jgi:hypothetical protein
MPMVKREFGSGNEYKKGKRDTAKKKLVGLKNISIII